MKAKDKKKLKILDVYADHVEMDIKKYSNNYVSLKVLEYLDTLDDEEEQIGYQGTEWSINKELLQKFLSWLSENK
jgi:hypothetical protein